MPDRRRYARTPDTIAVLAACFLAGLAMTVSGWAPASVLAITSYPVALLWSGTLGASAGLALAGVLWPDDLHGWVMETIGRCGLALSLLGYVAALTSAMKNPGTLFVIAIVLGLSIASGWRVRQLMRRWREFVAAIQAVQS